MAEESSGGKPGDFFVGLVDLFAILLPGGLLAFLTYTSLLRWGKLTSIAIPEGWIGFAVVGVVAYLLGHFLFVIASMCLDPVYDWWKDTWKVCQPGGWSDKNKPLKVSSDLWQSLKDRDYEQNQAKKANANNEISLKDAATSLRISTPGAAAEMDHLEADQKFFRGLILVFLFAWLTFFWDWKWQDTNWIWGGAALLLLPMFPFRILNGMWRVWQGDKWKQWKKQHANWAALIGWPAQPVRWAGRFIGWAGPLADARKEQRQGAIQLVTVALLLVGWIAWFRTTPPMSGWPQAVSEGSKKENPVLSVRASTGNLSVTAKSENNENRDVLWKLRVDHPKKFGAVLLFALALSVLRFVQQRLKYSKFVYRAYRILETARPQPGHDKAKARRRRDEFL